MKYYTIEVPHARKDEVITLLTDALVRLNYDYPITQINLTDTTVLSIILFSNTEYEALKTDLATHSQVYTEVKGYPGSL